MAGPRTTEGQVRALIEHATTLSMVPFIDTAKVVVDWLATQDTEGLLSADTLELIERWLAAHFYETRDPQYSSKNTGRSGAQFQGQTGYVLMSSKWGQQACFLDFTGRLAKRSKEAETGQRRKVGAFWLGTDCDRPDS